MAKHDHHKCECKHENLAYCKRCNTAYCLDCPTEWKSPCTENHWPYQWSWTYQQPTVTPTWTGDTITTDTVTFCAHGDKVEAL